MLARRRRGDRDGAKTHMLEIMVMLSIMVAAVTSVTSFQTSTSSFAPDQRALQDDAERFLAILSDTPNGVDPDCSGETWLSRVATDALGGEKDFFEERVATSLQGKEINLLLDNGRGKYPLITEFAGYANAGASTDFAPDGTWVMPVPLVSGVGGQEALVIDTPALRQGELFKVGGEAVQAKIQTRGAAWVTDRMSRSTEASGVTALPRADYQRDAVGDFYWKDLDSETPTLVHVADARETAPLDQQAMEFGIHLQPTGTSSGVAAGTEIMVLIPPGWQFDDSDPGTIDWDVIRSGHQNSGWSIRFTLRADAASPNELVFKAYAPPLPTQRFDLIRAQLQDGSLGQSTLVVQYDASLEIDLPLQAYLTTPYPLTRGEDAVFGVVFANGGAATTVKQLDIEIPGGYDLWHNDGGGAPLFEADDAEKSISAFGGSGSSGGTWQVVNARHLRWTGSHEVDASSAADWLVKVRITNDASVHTAFEEPASDGVVSRLALDNDVVATSMTLGPNVGVLRQRIAPDSAATTAQDGYPWSVVTEPTEHEYLVRIEDGGYHVETEASYTVVPDSSDLVQMDSALANSSTRVAQRLVPLGGVLQVQTDVESMVTDLAANGVTSSTMTVDIYSPLSGGCAPTASWTRDVASLPLAAIHDVDVVDEAGLGLPSAYLASADGSVYRVSATGALVWSRSMDSVPMLVDAAMMGPADGAVFVGDLAGTLSRLDLTLGTLLWSEATGGTFGGLPVITLHANATNGQLLVTTERAVEIRSAELGTLLARSELNDATSKMIGAEWAPEGGVVYTTTGGTFITGPLLADPEELDATSVVGATVGQGMVIVTHGRLTTAYDLDDHTITSSESHLDEPTFTATGDATGDGVPDHLVAMPDLSVKIYDGATFEETVRVPPVMTLGALGVDFDVPNYMPPLRDWNPDEQPLPLGEPAGFSTQCAHPDAIATLFTSQICVDPDHPGNNVPVPLDLVAHDGRVIFSYMLGPVPRLYGWTEPTGEPFISDWYMEIGQVPTTLWLGPWNAVEGGFGWGTSNGKAGFWGDTTYTQRWYHGVSEFVGQFVFNVGIPMGGFYGAHIVKMTLAWEDPAGGAREAHLLDWFHVVDFDGTPVAAPHYRIELNVRDPFMPMNAP